MKFVLLPELKDRYVLVDSNDGIEVGFTSDKFDGYMIKDKESIIIPLIVSLNEGKGNFKSLIDKLKLRYDNIIVTSIVSNRMMTILKSLGFKDGSYVSDRDTLVGMIYECHHES